MEIKGFLAKIIKISVIHKGELVFLLKIP